jgi:four helix bundle protein
VPNQRLVDSAKQYDLESRTRSFALRVRTLVKHIPSTPGNLEDSKQLLRASGSIGANYIEANESLGKKDFLMHIKICRKESKEARYWLSLLDVPTASEVLAEQNHLMNEATELMNIFGAIVRKCQP